MQVSHDATAAVALARTRAAGGGAIERADQAEIRDPDRGVGRIAIPIGGAALGATILGTMMAAKGQGLPVISLMATAGAAVGALLGWTAFRTGSGGRGDDIGSVSVDGTERVQVGTETYQDYEEREIRVRVDEPNGSTGEWADVTIREPVTRERPIYEKVSGSEATSIRLRDVVARGSDPAAALRATPTGSGPVAVVRDSGEYTTWSLRISGDDPRGFWIDAPGVLMIADPASWDGTDDTVLAWGRDLTEDERISLDAPYAEFVDGGAGAKHEQVLLDAGMTPEQVEEALGEYRFAGKPRNVDLVVTGRGPEYLASLTLDVGENGERIVKHAVEAQRAGLDVTEIAELRDAIRATGIANDIDSIIDSYYIVRGIENGVTATDVERVHVAASRIEDPVLRFEREHHGISGSLGMGPEFVDWFERAVEAERNGLEYWKALKQAKHDLETASQEP